MKNPQSKSTQHIGQAAELAAVNYLKTFNITMIERNFFCRCGEIDIIASQSKRLPNALNSSRDTLLFIEVRYRKHSFYGSPAASISRQKQQKIIKTAQFYLQKLSTNVQCRFDVIEVSPATGKQGFICNWIKNAFVEYS